MKINKIITIISIIGISLFIVAFTVYGLFGDYGKSILLDVSSKAVMFLLAFGFTTALHYRKGDTFDLICTLTGYYLLLIGYVFYAFCGKSPIWHAVSSLIFDSGTFLIVLNNIRNSFK